MSKANCNVELDTGRSEKKVWLVKVPNFVAERWNTACAQSAASNEAVGIEIGKVTLERPVGLDTCSDLFSQSSRISVGPHCNQNGNPTSGDILQPWIRLKNVPCPVPREDAPNTPKSIPLFSAGASKVFTYNVRETSFADNIKGVPREYNMRQVSEVGSSIYAFAEVPDLISARGRVDQRYDVEMRMGPAGQAAAELDPEYRRLSRERNRAAATKTRTAQVIAPQSIAKYNSAQAAKAYSSFGSGNKRKPEPRGEKKIIEKRVRTDKDALEKLIFRLFEKQDFWNFQQLVKETDQPVAWLKECLLEVAVQNKSPGLHRDQWQLKPEYRTREAATES